MPDPISTFFAAWQVDDAEARREILSQAVDTKIAYTDPRTPETIIGIDTLNDYVGMFSANAPGWCAKVIANDKTGSMMRSTVAFSGPGPDGTEQVQYGQYFVEMDADLVARMVGFVGTGPAT